ncbi:MAG: hypothetical protein A3A44_00655 [Candidatus Sungbacteria bacterium RIFCSPLOWO2_01_FULL_60_25]|uniref:DUF218 domain-containing protein n=1 Tax=Candidatus Sungbacteria bacterium RIFCSPLOWO2_01_FULL_60_25 TaxID=1802281 RepID=A0A1G2LBX7_9BACT|nr:MAG: hypothetical protein A3A44_00655 [Candidatus Sungbacteria bacterium RIFCSPLOWO2_01_FULL_60_25]
MAEHILVWVANGFDPEDPHRTDEFSRRCLDLALAAYARLKRVRGNSVRFPIINSVVRDRSGRIPLRDILWDEAVRVGVDPADMEFTIETTGSPTDGLAIAKLAKAHPGAAVKVFATTKETAEFFSVMYRAVALRAENHRLDFAIAWPSYSRADLKSRAMYRAMRLVTQAASLSRPMFLLWYHTLNFAYRRRLKGFTGTVRAR